MNEGQRRRILIEMENSLIFPVIEELGKVAHVLIPKSISDKEDDFCLIPNKLTFELVRIDESGKVLSRGTVVYKSDI